MSECLKYKKPYYQCMEYAIISHNIDFVTFLMNEYNIGLDLLHCGWHHNLESFLIYFEQTNDINKCFIYSSVFNTPSLCEYFLSHGANVNEKNDYGKTTLYIAAQFNSKEVAELLILQGANINEKDNFGKTVLQCAACYNSKEMSELLISHGCKYQ
ncbi:ankyrin repeat protein, putative [Trichomonas vaginalis G3]|uniref:Ankyrin repeat protein, putative n=1 Tax=Trichomonas vaginalis (strain ATCC PRA-98 / G3) TaxID=412133 RepID=A2F9V2_TRIV3|nr:ankyrin repeat and SOCS box-containing protein 4 family [Trichomonas vaginalis G3]EAX98280.1 ankyrin repeat protein, putative [Trichomonas vaginalis G3]KAI5517489.1 ankyrin repeat and SOCS box-containing protein 4 family [Trichomonas vaginalis G3]|eukprot:XP_001311210.1 ankyrin repeat protein [Trichomonas vaginalis G3]